MEELGCDHIFVTAEIRNAEEKANHTYVGDCHVLPHSLPFDTWNDTFKESDHRPVRSKLIFASQH
jgi:hypothetical protein